MFSSYWVQSAVHKCKGVTLLKETMCFNIHTRNSCHGTPKFLWFMFMPRTTHREKSVQPRPLWKLQLVPSVYFQGWDMAVGGMIGVNLPFEFCWQKNCSQLLKSRLFHSQPYLGKFSDADSFFTIIPDASPWIFWPKHGPWISLSKELIFKNAS